MSAEHNIDPEVAAALGGAVKSASQNRSVIGLKAPASIEQTKPAKLAERAVAKTHKSKDKSVVESEIVEGTKAIDATAFAESLRFEINEKKAKQQRLIVLLKNPSIQEVLKEFTQVIGGAEKAYERLILVAPDVRKGSFVRAWKECGYTTMATRADSDD